ncbi:MAG: PDZ domain-containing protein [Acidobacteria bacterium]|jgi:serine protease Do|nr:PDZ domain-containing protein [Acidobacteriota bacterium]
MKKALFVIIIMLLLWSAIGLRAVPQEDRRDRAADRIDDIENEIRAVLQRVSPSLVKVVAENGSKYVATGIALEGGLIITSAQVTRRPFAKLSVETSRGESIAARVAGQDDRSGLTLLRIDRKTLPTLPPGKPAEVGNWVALVGLFYEKFPAISQGIVSSLSANELILNAPVAPGSAGGAVVNKKGELLGVIRGSVGFAFTPDYTFKDHSASIVVSGNRSESGSLCYAIPAGQVQRIVQQLKTAGKIVPGWLGITFVADSNQVQEAYKESPAAKAGIAGGDRIEELAGQPIASFRDIVAALQFRYAGDTINLTVKRAGRPLRLRVELGEPRRVPLPPAPPTAPEGFARDLPHLAEQLAEIPEILELESALPRVRNYVIDFSGSRQLGIEVMEITADLGQKYAVKEGYGLLISRVDENSAAKKAGLKAGDVIVRANANSLRSAADLRKTMVALEEKEAVLLELYRDGQARKFSIVPDKNEKRAWDVRRFSQKMESLKGTISDEAKALLKDEIRKLLLAKEEALADLLQEKTFSLKKVKEESQKLAFELKRLQAEKDKLPAEARKRYAAELKRIQEELRLIREKMAAEAKKEPPAGGDGR